MQFEIKQYPLGSRPEVTRPDSRLLTILGETGIRKMVNDHYDLLIISQAKELFPQNEEGIAKAKQHAADFFIQYLGGPDYFNQSRGKPMMAARHSPFSITPDARIVWLECYREVLQKLEVEPEVLSSFWNYLEVFSQWMVNTRQ